MESESSDDEDMEEFRYDMDIDEHRSLGHVLYIISYKG